VVLLRADNREPQPWGTRLTAVMKVLIIDDDEDVRFVARMSLGRVAGMTVVEAARGQDGVALAKSEQPDFILLDMMMPDMDGAATLRALQAGEATASIPVVFLTARAMTSEVQRLKGLGVRGVVLKPFNPMTLASEITAILSG
jgi:two-component system alkaline phosphatase synthesis response regulator PhoP